jgi:thiaminase
MPSLTQALLDSDTKGFKTATQSKFLELAGKGKLNKSVLQKWLGQDRLYAQAYVRFASLLLANIELPSSINSKHINER